MNKRLSLNQIYDLISVFPLLQVRSSLLFSLSKFPLLELMRAFRYKRALHHDCYRNEVNRKIKGDSTKRWEWKSRSEKTEASYRRFDEIERSAHTRGFSKENVSRATILMERAMIRNEKTRPKSVLQDYLGYLLRIEHKYGERTDCVLQKILGVNEFEEGLWLALKKELVFSDSFLLPAVNRQAGFSFSSVSADDYLSLAEYYLYPTSPAFSPKTARGYLLKCPTSNPVVLRDLAYLYLIYNPKLTKEDLNLSLRTLFITSMAGDSFSSYLAGNYYFFQKEYNLARQFFEKGASNGDERCVVQIGNRIWNKKCKGIQKHQAASFYSKCLRSPEAEYRLYEICDSLGKNKEKEIHLYKAAQMGSFKAMEKYARDVIHKLKKTFRIRRFIYGNLQKEDPTGFWSLLNFRILTIVGCDGSPVFHLNKAIKKGHPLAFLYEELYYTHSIPHRDDVF